MDNQYIPGSTRTFADLFKKYRLKAEFGTYAAFGDALAQKGYVYEESIFSHWQKGKRIPSNRQLILIVIEIFVERKSIIREEEANEFLEKTGLGYLTRQEIQKHFNEKITKSYTT